jgi:hypothetical protein
MDWADYLRDEAAKHRQLVETPEDLSIKQEIPLTLTGLPPGFPWAWCTLLFSGGWLFSQQQVALSRVIRARPKANVHLRGHPHTPLRSKFRTLADVHHRPRY